MTRRFSLEYKHDGEKLDKWIQQCIAMHTHLNRPELTIGSDFFLEYTLNLSMREWHISRRIDNTKAKSKWALTDLSNSLIIDSAMRDHHVISLKYPERVDDCIKVSLPPLYETGTPSLYSLSTFAHLEMILKVEKSLASSQVRWMKIPGSMCEGIFFGSGGQTPMFMPISVSERAPGPFSVGNVYQTQMLFDFARETIRDD